MVTVSSTPSSGRAYLWAGIGVALLGIALLVVQYSLEQLVVPWYAPALATIGALLVVRAVMQRRTVVRGIALALVLALAAFEWYFVVSLSRLPVYEGPARAGQKIPSFQTTLADGTSFTDRDLQDGRSSVLVFFRGRW